MVVAIITLMVFHIINFAKQAVAFAHIAAAVPVNIFPIKEAAIVEVYHI